MLGIVLNTLYAQIHLILTALWGGFYYYTNYEKTETEFDQLEGYSQDLISGHLFQSVLLPSVYSASSQEC